jgi:hypothetical protein
LPKLRPLLFLDEARMWSWFNCYLSGRHEYGMWCEPGTIFLRCVHCGRRSPGWAVDQQRPQPAPAQAKPAKAQLRIVPRRGARVVPFNRTLAS